jgi:hypothetical protein
MNNFPKIIGWLVFFAGLSIISFTLWSTYNIFTAKSKVPEFFPLVKETKTPSSQVGTQDAQAQLQKMIGEQLQGFFPADFMGKTLNLTVWSMLAFILMSGGAKIAGLGIKLLKNEKKDERI